METAKGILVKEGILAVTPTREFCELVNGTPVEYNLKTGEYKEIDFVQSPADIKDLVPARSNSK